MQLGKCTCGHFSFRRGSDLGHYRGTGDNGVERTGPCRMCACESFKSVHVRRLRGHI